MAVCTNCAATVPDEAKFCPACGQAIVTADVQPVVPEPAPAQNQAETPLPQENQMPQSYYAEPQSPAPQQSYYAEPQSPAPQQSYYAQPQSPAPQQSYYAQQSSPAAPQNPAPQSYYAQPNSPAQPPQQSYYAAPQNQAPQQSYYAAPQNQAPQQSYYAPQQAPNPQQSYYAQQQTPNNQQNYYAQQNPNPQQNNYGYGQNYQQPGQNYQAGPQDIAENKGLCVLCYLGILLLIPLLSKPNSPYVKYHANQGLLVLILGILVGFLSWIPYLGWYLIGPFGSIFILVLVIMGIVNTVNGQMKPLPLIGKISLIK